MDQPIKAKRKSVATQLAEHFGDDVAEIRPYAYQRGHWTPTVYSGMDGNNYWSAGLKPPRYLRGQDDLDWQRVESSWKGNGPLWRASKIKQS